MQKTLFAIAAVSAVTLLAMNPARAEYAAYGQGRFCAVVSNGTGSVKEICDFNDIDSCIREVVSGNRGFCRYNSYVQASPGEPRRKQRHHSY